MELQHLYEVVNFVDWFAVVRSCPCLCHRTDGAIRRRMCQLREESGIIPLRSSGARASYYRLTERQQAEQSSALLLERLLEMAW
jgi:hypothetical protein